MDIARRAVTRAGRPVELTLKEYGVLVELVRAGGAVVSAEELLERVWDEHADPFSNAVRVTMVGLRRKLGEPPVIETLRGAGYRVCAVRRGLSVRWRLTIVYSLISVASATVLLGRVYVVVSQTERGGFFFSTVEGGARPPLDAQRRHGARRPSRSATTPRG